LVGDVLRRHTPPSFLLIAKENRHGSRKAFREKARFSAQNCGGQNGVSRCQAFLPEMRVEHQTEMKWKGQPDKLGQVTASYDKLGAFVRLARLLRNALFRGFDRLVGDGNHVTQDGVHPGVHIGGSFLGRFLHADNSTEDLAYA
jgi:hypothetical protein